MLKVWGSLVVTLVSLGAAPLAALADHERDGGGFTFRFGSDGFTWGRGYRQEWRDRELWRERRDWDVREERDWRGGWNGGYAPQQPTGRWEYQTETYVVTPGFWTRTFVDNGYSGYYTNRWVEPRTGTRTVRVWVVR